MRTLMDIAKQSMGSTTTPAPGALAGIYNSSGVSSIRYGTVQSVSGEVVSILLEDTGELVTTRTSTPVDVGHRVALIKNGQNVIVYSTEEIMNQINNKISRVDVEYALSTSPTVAPSDGWSTTAPSEIPDGQYLWTRTVTYTQGGTSSISDPVCITTDAAQGKTLKDITEQYYLSTSRYTQSGGSWQDTCPQWQENRYIWTRSKLSWSDGSTTYTTPVLATAINQANEEAWNATQYFWYDARGAHVATSPRSTAGLNALLASGGLRVMDGDTEMAAFEAARASLAEGMFEIVIVNGSITQMGAKNMTVGVGTPGMSGWSQYSVNWAHVIESANLFYNRVISVRRRETDWTFPSTDTILPLPVTETQIGAGIGTPNNLYSTSNYVRISKPSVMAHMLVRISAQVTTNFGGHTQDNIALSVYAGTSSSFSRAEHIGGAIQSYPTNGGCTVTITPFFYSIYSDYAYFWLVARSSSGTSSINPGANNYLTIETVECDNYAVDVM